MNKTVIFKISFILLYLPIQMPRHVYFNFLKYIIIHPTRTYPTNVCRYVV